MNILKDEYIGVGMTLKNSNLVSFRLNQPVLFAIENRLQENQTVAQFCQKIINDYFNFEEEPNLKKDDFENILSTLVDDKINERIIPILNDLRNQIEESKKTVEPLPQTKAKTPRTPRKPKVDAQVNGKSIEE